MSDNQLDRLISLAGIFQAAYTVKKISIHGAEESAAIQASIESIFKVDAEDAADVFSGKHGVTTGLTVICDVFCGNSNRPDIDVSRYLASMMQLERKLIHQPQHIEKIQNGIRAIAQQTNYFGSIHKNVIASLADLYQNTISQMQPRIMVTGKAAVLSNPHNAELIRAILLAGIRACVLWRQLGGRRRELWFRRRQLCRQATELLHSFTLA